MSDSVFWIPGTWPGRLGIVLRPRGGDWLEDEIRVWKAAGIDGVVSALTPGEVRELELGAEGTFCEALGIRFRSFPIPDRGVPSAVEAVRGLVADLTASLEAGHNVVAHCRQSIGRAAIIVALVLTSSGQDPARAFEAVEKARGCPVPDTAEQRVWVEAVAGRLRLTGVPAHQACE
jgi:protein-tyrosine phosphatase